MLQDPTLIAWMLVLLMVIGGFAGVLAGLLGVGGGIVLVPAFFYAFQTLGYDGPNLMQICLATSLATIIVTSLRSLHSHNRKGAVDWDILKSWGPGIVIGAVLGMLTAASVKSHALQVLFGVLAFVIGLYLLLGKPEWRLGDAMPKGIKRAVLSPLVGFLSVLMGIGGGSFGVPLMTLYGRPIHRAVATAAGFGVAIAVPSVIGFLFYTPPEGQPVPPLTVGAVNLPAFLVVIAMTLITTPLGVKLAHATDPKPLRRIFAVFLLLVALNMLRKAIWG
ncbi:sulfite exporter TauE/SafE family protein [Pseudooceanicola sp. LIPI14-2-Ac024]|uniref:sulfite exporter TauE/SafE family protein n=1 Tax=Pseudooceanicola sp. LIPI14-2-Ac024 TaxID=3344875 RepID=UPI0035D0B8AF